MSHKGIDIALKKEANNLQPNDNVCPARRNEGLHCQELCYKVLKKEEDVPLPNH